MEHIRSKEAEKETVGHSGNKAGKDGALIDENSLQGVKVLP